MPQCVILNITDNHDWRHQAFPHGKFHPGIYIPNKQRSGLIHPTREDAEKEAVRLACETGGRFAVFELTDVVSGEPLSDSDRVKGMGPCGARVPRWETENPEV